MPARPTGIKFRYEANVDAAEMAERIAIDVLLYLQNSLNVR